MTEYFSVGEIALVVSSGTIELDCRDCEIVELEHAVVCQICTGIHPLYTIKIDTPGVTFMCHAPRQCLRKKYQPGSWDDLKHFTGQWRPGVVTAPTADCP